MPLLDPIPQVLCAGTINIIAGSSGAGKSGLLCSWMRAMLDGEPILGHATNQPPAMAWISMDRPWRDMQYWFDQYQLPAADIRHFSRIDEPATVSLQEICNARPWQLAEYFTRIMDRWQLPPGSLVIVDPIPLFVGADQNHYVRMAVGYGAMYDVVNAPDRQYCLIGADHPAKQMADAKQRYRRLEDRIGGSGAKGAHSNTLMYLAEPGEIGEESHHTLYWRPRRAQAETFAMAKDPETGKLSPMDLMGAVVAKGTPVLLPAWRPVLGQIPEAPASIATADLVATLTEHAPKRTLERYLDELKTAGLVHQPRRGVWQQTAQAKVVLNSPAAP